MKIHNASCLCSGVRFKIRGELRPVIYCHCSQCLKTQGTLQHILLLQKNRSSGKTRKPSAGLILPKKPGADSAENAERASFMN